MRLAFTRVAAHEAQAENRGVALEQIRVGQRLAHAFGDSFKHTVTGVVLAEPLDLQRLCIPLWLVVHRQRPQHCLVKQPALRVERIFLHVARNTPRFKRGVERGYQLLAPLAQHAHRFGLAAL